jgi:hypothetical protein
MFCQEKSGNTAPVLKTKMCSAVWQGLSPDLASTTWFQCRELPAGSFMYRLTSWSRFYETVSAGING